MNHSISYLSIHTWLRSNKNFSRKPITQIRVVPEDSILVTIKEGVISVHDIGEVEEKLRAF